MEQGVSAERVIRGSEDGESTNRFRLKYRNTEHKVLLLPAVVMDSYLERLSTAKCNVWAKELHSRNSQLPMTLY